MISQREAQRLLKQVLKLAKGKGQAEVILTSQDEALTRFANNQITQNVSQCTMDLMLRIQRGGRTGRATTRDTHPDALESLVLRAAEALEASRSEKGSLPMIGRKIYRRKTTGRGPIFLASPEGRQRAVREIIQTAKGIAGQTAGIVSFETGRVSLANSLGCYATQPLVSGRVSITIQKGEASGWADGSGATLTPKDVTELSKRAKLKCVQSRKPRLLDPGHYPVILEPACVGDLLQFMAWYGLGAQLYQEGQSFLCGKLSKQIFSQGFHLEDNVYHPLAMGLPFDFEGVPRCRTVLIDQGVARGVVYDRRTARLARKSSTGHGLPEPNEIGPLPLNLVLKGGSSSLPEMIRSTKRGVLVTHFHYTNIMDHKRLMLTGLTRDGTFLIEHGKVQHPIQNFRFTESLLNAFSRIEEVSKEQVYTEGFFGGGFVVPALKVGKFHFTSLAEKGAGS